MKRPMFFYEGDGVGGGGGSPAVAAPAATASTLLPGAPSGDATPAPAASGFSWAKEDGTLDAGWLDKFDGDLKGNPSLKSIGTIQDLAKSYVETKKLIGTKLSAPGEGSTPEQIASWRKTVGAPEKPEGYYGDAKTLRPESVPEEFWDTSSEQEFLGIAHKHHLPPAAVNDILKYYGGNIAKSLEAAKGQEVNILAQEGDKLKQAWGADHGANLALASRVAMTLGMDPSKDPAFTSSAVVQAFAKMGKLLSEDRLVKGDSAGITGSITEKAREITDPKSTSIIAREYRGEFGADRQAAAQTQYHQLLAAQQTK